VITDAEGASCGIGPSSTSRSLSRTEEYLGRCFQSFPRRSESLLLHVLQFDNQVGRQRRVATFALRNPAERKFPEWKASPLPVSGRDGDLEFTLTRLVGGIDFRGDFGPDSRGQPRPVERRATNALDSATLAAFRIADKGRALTNWQPVRIEAWDATGNYLVNTSWRNEVRDDEQRMIYQWGLWPNEPAWKLRVEFSRTSGFTPQELWTVKGLSLTNVVPQSQRNFGSASGLTPVTETNLMGSTLQIMPLLDRGGSGGPLDSVALHIRINPPPSGLRLTLVSVTDETGRSIERSGTSWSNDYYEFGLRNLQSKRSLEVTLACHPSRYAEFIARPQRLQ